jgi:D-alanyl-D-alanine carboxypeptidase/D-alanyl-D-alanine-endopeptidase (penicillin-binding protein 4)
LVRRALAVAVIAFALPGTAAARVADTPSPSQLGHALRDPAISSALTGAVAIDLSDGATRFATRPRKPLRPASTEKLTVAVAALDRLGPNFRTHTLVLGTGEQKGRVWDGDLFLKGFGDPSLHTDDLDRLARNVRALGIRTVTGRALGDESYFDRLRVGPGWKPAYYIDESAPLSALIVDRAWLDGRTRNQPAVAAAKLFARALRAAGVHVVGKPGRGVAPDDAAELASVPSPRLRGLVDYMDTESDNFVAEMLVKQLGARDLGEGSTSAGMHVVRSVLAEHGVPLAGVVVADGSGLSRFDRLTARALAALLVAADANPRLAAALRASLPVAGKTGTLQDRMTRGPAYGVVRAKTGTTSRASALAGYAGHAYAFAILINGSPVAAEAARTAQDRFAQVLAGAK